MWNDDFLQTIDNNAFNDMCFDKCMEINEKCTLNSGCYYFSLTSGIAQKVSNDQTHPEVNHGIKQFADKALGFDLDSVNRLKWQDIPRQEGTPTLARKALTVFAQVTDPVFTSFQYFLNNQKFDLPSKYELQSDDVSWDALKWDQKRWNEDNDTLLARVTQEFPRISHDFNRLSDSKKPWGDKTPQPFNWEDNTFFTRFEKGRWFYSNIENTNHLDLCGWPNIFRHFRVLLGIENRYRFYKQLFDRIYSLEF